MAMNQETFSEIVQAWFLGDRSSVMNYFSPDLVWRILGTETVTPGAAGVYKGFGELQALGTNVEKYARD